LGQLFQWNICWESGTIIIIIIVIIIIIIIIIIISRLFRRIISWKEIHVIIGGGLKLDPCFKISWSNECYP
jgi:hypothetical protein